MCSSAGSRLLVGSKSTQPTSGQNTANHAWLASAPTSRWLAFRRTRAQIAADVARRQAERTQARDGQMREVLADAAPLSPDFLERRRHGGGRGIEFEIGKNAAVQIARRRRAAAFPSQNFRARNRPVPATRTAAANQKQIDTARPLPAKPGRKTVSPRPPSPATAPGPAAWSAATVTRLRAVISSRWWISWMLKPQTWLPKKSTRGLTHRRHRLDVQRKIFHLLLRQPARLDARRVMRDRHRRGVFVNRAMDEVVGHGWKPPPVREISECAK